MNKKCNRYFIDNCSQGFTTPHCALNGSPNYSRRVYPTFVKYDVDFNNCDFIAEVKSWDADSICANNTYGETL